VGVVAESGFTLYWRLLSTGPNVAFNFFSLSDSLASAASLPHFMNPLRSIHGLIATGAEWVGIKISRLDRIDGVVVCDLTPAQPSKDAFLELTREAMALIKSLDTRRYRRVCRHLRYIENTALLSKGQYGRKLKVCRVDYAKNFNSPQPQRNIRDYAGTIIHEATHGLLLEKGIPYDKATRERVERLCHLESYRFFLHFEPGYAHLYLGPYNPEGHKRSWESSKEIRRAAWWKRFQETYKSSFPKNARDYQWRGRTHARKGQYDKAIAEYDVALRLDPQFAEAYLGRGAAYQQKGSYEEAISDFSYAIQLKPQDAMAYTNRGTAYLQKRDFDAAVADYDHAIQLNPQYARAYINRGMTYLEKQNLDAAVADHDRAIQLDPKSARAYLNRGNAFLGKLDYEMAVADYCRAVQLDPKSAAAHQNLAWLLATCPQANFRNGKNAVEHAMKACLLSEWKNPVAVKILAAAYAEAGDFENAVKWQSEYSATPKLSPQAQADAQRALALYQEHKSYSVDTR
jgi:tetratricopeptide (TPR) repeat protein